MACRVTLLIVLALVAACSAEQPPAAALSGQQAYEQACARCHDEGTDGAPRTGDSDAWAGRSMLWEAVLFEHAKKGYLEMPAKGGEETLDGRTVERAAEYMLSITFPEAPKD